VQHGDAHVKQEKKCEEWLGRVEKFRSIELRAPGESDDERERKPDQVQLAPRLVPGDGQDAAVEHGVKTEERDVAAATR
jgi:hypothetical protein